MIDKITAYYPDETFLTADGFDNAIIGVDETEMKLIYSVTMCIKILMKDMSYEDAVEHFNFNVAGSYVGEKTPIWCYDECRFENIIDNLAFSFSEEEKIQSSSSADSLEFNVASKIEGMTIEQLREEINKAISNNNFEYAAFLRDAIRNKQ